MVHGNRENNLLILILIKKKNKVKEIDNNYITNMLKYHANSTINKCYFLASYKLLTA